MLVSTLAYFHIEEDVSKVRQHRFDKMKMFGLASIQDDCT